MTQPADDDLLQRALDGALDARDNARLQELLRSDASLRARAEQLRHLVDLIEDQDVGEPPPAFADEVMARLRADPERPTWLRGRATWASTIGRQLLAGLRHHSGQAEKRPGWITGWTGGGAIVAKKALWAVAGLALAVTVGVIYYNGTRTVDQGAEGTIGAAQRYRGAQPTAADVKADQVAAQQFLQTDLFDRMIKDKNVRNMLSDPATCDLLRRVAQVAVAAQGGEDTKEAWADLHRATKALAQAPDDGYAALRSRKARAAIAEMEDVAALKRKEVRAFLGDAEAASLYRRAQASFAGQPDEAWAEALHSQKAVKVAAADGDALNLLRRNATFRAAMAAEPQEMANLARRHAVMEALDDAAFMNLWKSQPAMALIDDANFANLVKKHGRFMNAFDDAEFANLVRQARFTNVFGENADFAEAMALKSFSAALREQSALTARLKNFSE